MTGTSPPGGRAPLEPQGGDGGPARPPSPAPAVSPELRRARWLLTGLVVVLVAGALLRRGTGLEWSAEGLRDTIASWGVWGPTLFVAIVSVRMLILIPAPLLLIAGGIAFGAAAGALWGALGLCLAALGQYGAVRWASPEALRTLFPIGLGPAIRLARTPAAPWLLTATSAYPAGPIALAQIAAAIAGMGLGQYALSVGVGGAIRAGAFALFGEALLGGRSLLLATGLLLAMALLPLAFPSGRAWLRSVIRRPES